MLWVLWRQLRKRAVLLMYELLGSKQCSGHRGQVVRLDGWLVWRLPEACHELEQTTINKYTNLNDLNVYIHTYQPSTTTLQPSSMMHDLLALHLCCGPSEVSTTAHLSVSTPPLMSHIQCLSPTSTMSFQACMLESNNDIQAPSLVTCPNWCFQRCCLLPTDHIFFQAVLPFKHDQLALHLLCGPFESLVCCI